MPSLTKSRRAAAALLLFASLTLSDALPLFAAQHRQAKHGATHSSTHKQAAVARGRRATRGRLHRVTIVKRRGRRRALTARELAKTRQLSHAFTASAQLRPMAQQLANYRSPAAYAGVEAYAHAHSGAAAEAAWLALGHAYLLDHRYPDSLAALHNANSQGTALADYSDYFAAQANLQSSQLPAADRILSTFAAKHQDSIFTPQIPVLEANLLLQQNQAAAALAALRIHSDEPLAAKPDFLLAEAKAQAALNQPDQALALYRRILNDHPLSPEAAQAQQHLQQSGQWLALTLPERRRHADALFNGGKYNEASAEFRTLAVDASLNAEERDSLLLAAATCDMKLRRLSAASLAGIPDSNDENGARRLYLLMEVARNNNDLVQQQSLVEQLRTRFPTSPSLAESLFSSGNLYMLRKDLTSAIPYYLELSRRFPQSKQADNAHWRAAWLSYRVRNYPQAEQLMDEQLVSFRGGTNTSPALYWRGRLFLDQQHDPATAAAYFATEARVFQHYYYAELASRRLAALGTVTPASIPALQSIQPEQIPTLTEDVPEDDPHLAKARLLANAGLNDYLAPEIHAAEDSDEWGSLAEAKLYASYGEAYRAMRSLKRAIPYYTSAPIDELPLTYWRILFPEDYWSTIQAEAERNGLDPYMVASLIRQESEFNPRVVSYANAYGLMQLEPATGRQMARKTGFSTHLDPDALLDPAINIKLGCAYLKQTLDRFGGQQEYAFASYNAGESRVDDWKASGDYSGMDEWVESIPFAQTREYVQALMRNEQIYRELGQAAKTRAAIDRAAAGPPGAAQ